MASILDEVKIIWNEGHDTYLTHVESSEPVLKDFFQLDGWEQIHTMSKCVAVHHDFECGRKGFLFKGIAGRSCVELYTDKGSSTLSESDFLTLMLYLFELLIAGANDDHHTIRYEIWWFSFTNYMFQIQEQLCCNES